MALQRNDLAEADRLCRRMLDRDAADAEALGLTGIIAVKTRDLDRAVPLLIDATATFPEDASLHLHLGAAHLLMQRPADALAALDRSIALRPNDPVALNVRACALGSLRRFEESIECCDRAVRLKPGYAAALVNRGNALVELDRYEQALNSFESALAADPVSIEAINNCANTLKSLGRHAEALRYYDRALTLQPAFAEAAFNRSVALAETGRIRDALKGYVQTLRVQPDHLLARYNASLCRLLLGDFRGAWQDHDSWLTRSARDGRQRRFPQPRWHGERSAIMGKTILLHADEGLGDTLQFSRYAHEVAAMGARVVLEVQRPLQKVLRALAPVCRIVPRGARLPRFDLHCPLMGLPAACMTTLESIPERGPYIASDPRLESRWRRRLNSDRSGSGPRIGIVWSGNPAHANDSNRSIPLGELEPLFTFDADWISLQKETRKGDTDLLAGQTSVRHFGANIHDFADTAAMIAQTELVIAVDTSVAHLAGAMGKPVWILLPKHPDWRWLLDRSDSPWYPSARLFRQRHLGDWSGVVRSVRRALSQRFGR